MNILVIGSGGREHAICLAIANSQMLNKLYAAPGNPGIAQVAENINVKIDDFAALGEFCTDKNIDLVVVGPEAPLAAGLLIICRSKILK